MFEKLNDSDEKFVFPDIAKEGGEFDIASEKFGIESSVLTYLAQSESALVELPVDIWDKLENTDSNRIEKDDWNAVKEFSEAEGVNRDWKSLKEKLSAGGSVDAPIILKYGDRYHKISGNTRLMVARALGIKPKVLMVEVEVNKEEG